MSRRKDLERYLRLKEQNPGYAGFRGVSTVAEQPEAVLETIVCSVCQRKRNVASETLPEDRSTFVCRSCQEPQAE